MLAAQSALVVLATLLGVAGFSLSVSASAIPRLPRFRPARRRVSLIAAASLAASIAFVVWLILA